MSRERETLIAEYQEHIDALNLFLRERDLHIEEGEDGSECPKLGRGFRPVQIQYEYYGKAAFA